MSSDYAVVNRVCRSGHVKTGNKSYRNGMLINSIFPDGCLCDSMCRPRMKTKPICFVTAGLLLWGSVASAETFPTPLVFSTKPSANRRDSSSAIFTQSSALRPNSWTAGFWLPLESCGALWRGWQRSPGSPLSSSISRGCLIMLIRWMYLRATCPPCDFTALA